MRKKWSGLGREERQYWSNQIGVKERDGRFLIARTGKWMSFSISNTLDGFLVS